MNYSRLILIVAALVATVSVGVITLRPKPAPEPAAANNTPANTPPDIGQMIAAIEARLKTSPDDVEGWRMLGLAFSQTQRFAESATAYKRAAQLAPDKAENWSNLGEALVMASKGDVPPDAKAAFATAFARDPKDVRARYFLAVSKDIAGDHKTAINEWIALLKDSPPGAPWEADVIALINQVGTKEKIEVASRLAAIGRSATPAVSTKDQDAMIASMVDGLAQKLKANPKNVEGWIMLMRSYSSLGRTKEMQAALASALAANPADAATINKAAAEFDDRPTR